MAEIALGVPSAPSSMPMMNERQPLSRLDNFYDCFTSSCKFGSHENAHQDHSRLIGMRSGAASGKDDLNVSNDSSILYYVPSYSKVKKVRFQEEPHYYEESDR